MRQFLKSEKYENISSIDILSTCFRPDIVKYAETWIVNTLSVIKIKHNHIYWYDINLVINAMVWRRSSDQSVNAMF